MNSSTSNSGISLIGYETDTKDIYIYNEEDEAFYKTNPSPSIFIEHLFDFKVLQATVFFCHPGAKFCVEYASLIELNVSNKNQHLILSNFSW